MKILDFLCSVGLVDKRRAMNWGLRQLFGTAKGTALSQVVDLVAAGTHTVSPVDTPAAFDLSALVNNMRGL